jgi:hypothetical protein
MPRSPAAVFLALSAVTLCNAAIAGTAAAGGGDEAVKASRAPSIAVATEQKPATVRVQGGGGAALKVTARPVGGEGSSPPYLVGIFVGDGQSGDAAPKLLGSFSFYSPRAGQADTFVIPTPQLGNTAAGKDVTLSFKLIPANPAADIKDAAVEILGAQLE